MVRNRSARGVGDSLAEFRRWHTRPPLKEDLEENESRNCTCPTLVNPEMFSHCATRQSLAEKKLLHLKKRADAKAKLQRRRAVQCNQRFDDADVESFLRFARGEGFFACGISDDRDGA
jgi:hypothetical protein